MATTKDKPTAEQIKAAKEANVKKQLAVIELLGHRLDVRFALAHTALSAAWCMDDGLNPEFCLQTAEIAACLVE